MYRENRLLGYWILGKFPASNWFCVCRFLPCGCPKSIDFYSQIGRSSQQTPIRHQWAIFFLGTRNSIWHLASSLVSQDGCLAPYILSFSLKDKDNSHCRPWPSLVDLCQKQVSFRIFQH